MSTSDVEDSKGLPLAPWVQPPPIPASHRKPKYRHLIPATLLVVTLPAAIWHLYGDQTRSSEDSSQLYFIWRAPSWLNELPHPMGPVLWLATVAALIWLVWEYWRQSWRRWWFVVLGTLCMMCSVVAFAGRNATEGVSESDYIIINNWVVIENSAGWASLLRFPSIFGVFFALLGVSVYKISPSFALRCLSHLKIQSGIRPVLFTVLFGFLTTIAVAIALIMSKAALSPTSRFSFNEAVDLLVVHIPFVLLFSIVGILLQLAVAAIGLMATWLLLFRSADWALKRRIYW